MSTSPLLFSIEEALSRLGESKSRGCLLVFNIKEAIHIFVEDGSVVSVSSGGKAAEEMLTTALDLEEAAYRWIPDAEPKERIPPINIREFVSRRHPASADTKYKTIQMATYQRRDRKPEFLYFFVPEEAPATKLRLRKSASVVGRDTACDLHLDSFQVSRRHCLLEITDRGLYVKDLDSTNGTFINGVPLKDGYINSGDRLSLGTYTMTLRREKATA